MTKDNFVEVLKKAGYGSAHIKDNIVTVDVVSGDKKELRKIFIDIKHIALKVGYKHSYRVCKLEEVNGRES